MLSVVIIAWNEENNLERVVSSVRQLADEVVVVVDEASMDKTLSVAKKLKCKVFTHPHTGIVEPMRNFAITKAEGPWILLLDADEQVSAGLASEIKSIVAEDRADYVRVPRKNIIFGKWIKSDHWWPDYVYRLFKKDSLIWDDKIHSLPLTRGVGVDIPAKEDHALIHHNYGSITEYMEQLDRYTNFQSKQLQSAGYLFKWTDIIKKPTDEFLSQYYARRGYKAGLHGLALALLQAFSELVLYLKLWEASGFLETDIKSENLKSQLAKSAADYRWWKYEAKIKNSNFIVSTWQRLLRKVGI